MMQAYTEEQRKALIKQAEHMLTLTAPNGLSTQLFKIALASLTAEPVKTKLKYSSVLPKFIGDTNEVESVHCWIHGDTPEYATNEEAYAEAKRMTGYLYTTPPAPALRLPDKWTLADAEKFISDMTPPTEEEAALFARNGLLDEIERLNATAPQPELTVWYGSMPESNGKSNWTAILYRKEQGMIGGPYLTIDVSEYPDRVRLAADEVRYLIGELVEEPDMLAYDTDKHSGYVAPATSPQPVPDGWKLVPVIAFPSQWAAGQKAFDSAGINKIDAVYKAMVAAAPEMENAK